MIYKLPLLERVANLARYPSRCTLVCVDGVSVFVGHDSETVSPDEVRSAFISTRERFTYIIADCVEEAMGIFRTEWEGARGGRRGPESNALRINPDKPIIPLPECERLHWNREGMPICGEEILYDDDEDDLLGSFIGNGEFGMCVLAGGYDPPSECPVWEAENFACELEQPLRLPTS